ncbi:hypothetical protein ABTE85_21475, partial [Acinetobacter baumannii]
MTARYQQTNESADAQSSVKDGLPVAVGHATRDRVGEVLLKLDVNNARDASACGMPQLEALVASAHRVVPLTVTK